MRILQIHSGINLNGAVRYAALVSRCWRCAGTRSSSCSGRSWISARGSPCRGAVQRRREHPGNSRRFWRRPRGGH